MLMSGAALAQDKATTLRPPAGSKVAIVEFEDLQCPDCRNAAPVVREAAKTYGIPLVEHDFPLPKHNWSFDAAVNARWFDQKSKKLGDAYRSYIYQNQPAIANISDLVNYTQQFAKSNGIDFPFAVDPQGKLAAAVKADFSLGQRVGIEHTPTIYVVSNTKQGNPFVEIVDRSKLFEIIDQMKAEAGDTGAATTEKKAAPKTVASKSKKSAAKQ